MSESATVILLAATLRDGRDWLVDRGARKRAGCINCRLPDGTRVVVVTNASRDRVRGVRADRIEMTASYDRDERTLAMAQVALAGRATA